MPASESSGSLCGRGPTGITATTAPDAALEGADVLCYTATGDSRPHEAGADMALALRRGIDVVSTSMVSLGHPGSAPDQRLVQTLEAACEAGGASCFTSGIDPGVESDLLPMTLLGLCSRVDRIRVTENLDYSRRIIVEHVTRLATDVAPDWPTVGTGSGGYRIQIDGNPRVAMDLQIVGEDGDHNTGGLVVSVMRLLHSIPAVRAAAPGLLTPHDLPALAAAGAMAAHQS